MLRIVVPAAAVILAASPVVAQDFLGALARSAAGAVASRVAGQAAAAVVRPQQIDPLADPAAAPAPAAAPSPSQSVAPAVVPVSPPITPDATFFPAAVNYRPGMKSLANLSFSRDYSDERIAMIDFTVYSCSDCEGDWSAHQHPPEQYSDDAEVIGGLAVGQSVSWRMRGSDTMGYEVVSDLPIGDIPCKWAKMFAKRGGKTLERPRVACLGLWDANRGNNGPTWHSVFG